MKNKLFGLIIAAFAFLLIAPATFARCSETKPAKPVLLSAVAADRSVTLNWQGVPDPVTYYLVQYGTSKEHMEYGNPNIGGRGATSFTIGELQNGVKYYFQIRAGNGCKPGNFSDTLSAVAGQPGSGAEEGPDIPTNLDIYKNVLGESTLATDRAKLTSTPSAFPKVKTILPADPCKTSCYGLPLLAGEIGALFLFFLISSRFGKIKPYMSVTVPVVSYIFFHFFNGRCGENNFYCKYFLPLTVIIYVIMLVAQKYILIDIDRKK